MSDPTQLRPPVSDPTQLRPPVSDPTQLPAMRAVLWDMDGTLVDSEKLWDVSMHALYGRLGGVLTPEVRTSTVGGSSEGVMRIVYSDLGLEPDPAAMAESADWLHVYTGELFEAGLPWLPGAQELLERLVAAEVPLALVTNTRRDLTERALNSIGRHYFSVTVCGDEVAARQASARPVRTCRGVARFRSGAVPGHRGLRDGHRGGRGGRLSGCGRAE